MNRTLRNIFIALICLLCLTVAAAFVDFGRYLPGHHWSLLLALAVAVVKALLIARYFMHLKQESRVTTAFAIAGVLWLSIFAVLAVADYATRNHPPELNFKGEPRYLQQINAR